MSRHGEGDRREQSPAIVEAERRFAAIDRVLRLPGMALCEVRMDLSRVRESQEADDE